MIVFRIKQKKNNNLSSLSIIEESSSESRSENSSETEDFQIEFEATSCGLDEPASATTETQNYIEPYAEEP